ncbi:MAG: hypothetical protein ABIO41_06080 [Ignavibacteria bacterium]
MNTGDIILIVSISVPLITALIIFLLRRGLTKDAASAIKINERKSKAIPVNARIISAKQGLEGGSIKSIVHFKFEILDGGFPYETKATWFVESLYFSKIQQGDVISVKADRENKFIIYPDVPWAVYTEGYDKTGMF